MEIIKKFGGIGKFMTYPGVVFTDSGGFQMYSPRLYISSKDEGVLFRNPFSGEERFLTPEEDIEIQLGLNSDVAMCLDSMPLIGESKESITEAVRKTTLWARRCKTHHDAKQSSLAPEQRQLLFGIIQGGIHADLREHSAKELVALDFLGYSIGGLALGEPKEEEYEMIEVAKSIIPEHKPVYLMGAGNPLELLEAIARGVDCFDSRFATKNARRGTMFTEHGILRVLNEASKDDSRPIDESCTCFVCKRYSRAYLRHLLMSKEGVGCRFASYHNIFFIQELMRRARTAIQDGTFPQLLEKIKKGYKGYGD